MAVRPFDSMSISSAMDRVQSVNDKDTKPQALSKQRHKVRSVFVTQQLVMDVGNLI